MLFRSGRRAPAQALEHVLAAWHRRRRESLAGLPLAVQLRGGTSGWSHALSRRMHAFRGFILLRKTSPLHALCCTCGRFQCAWSNYERSIRHRSRSTCFANRHEPLPELRPKTTPRPGAFLAPFYGGDANKKGRDPQAPPFLPRPQRSMWLARPTIGACRANQRTTMFSA